MAQKTNGTTPDGITPTQSGLWLPQLNLVALHYGTGCVQDHFLSRLPSLDSKAIIVTGASVASKTPLIKDLEILLGTHHAGTISNIRQHGPAADLENAVERFLDCKGVDTIISVGGGSPIDTAKVVSLRVKKATGVLLRHLTIPTTLSAAECTAGGGFTNAEGVKIGFRDPDMAVHAIFYDPAFARYTPKELWLSTGMRALDHAVECMYHPTASEVPWKALALWAVGELFACLPAAQAAEPPDDNVNLRLILAAFASSGLKGANVQGGMGLSHSLGHALGSPYNIPHGITSCMTLAKVVELKAREPGQGAVQIARLLPAMGGCTTGGALGDALEVSRRIAELVKALELEVPALSERGVDRGQVAIITQKALAGEKRGPWYEKVEGLVETLF